MIIYSEVSLVFLREVKAICLKILNYEMGLSFQRSRLKLNGYLYPLDLVVFEHPNILGQYIPSKYQIQINKALIYRADKVVLENIIRHELCHYLTHLEFGSDVPPHGKEFQSICRRFQYDNNVSNAKIELQNNINKELFRNEKIFSKIKKLFQLSNSCNQHEAELATLKANELLMKHNLSCNEFAHHDETVLLPVIQGKKVTSKHQAIYQILQNFLVSPVFNYTKGSFQLEVIGERTNVLIAEYMAHFLNHHLEFIYEKARKDNILLKGPRAKKSFMNGVALGFNAKLDKLKRRNFSTTDIITCGKQLQIHLKRAYPRIKGRASAVGTDNKIAKALGKKAGNDLQLNPAIANKNKITKQLN